MIAGLGGRPITRASLDRMLRDALAGRLDALTFLDLNRESGSTASSIACVAHPRSGPAAENILRDIGTVAGGPHG